MWWDVLWPHRSSLALYEFYQIGKLFFWLFFWILGQGILLTICHIVRMLHSFKKLTLGQHSLSRMIKIQPWLFGQSGLNDLRCAQVLSCSMYMLQNSLTSIEALTVVIYSKMTNKNQMTSLCDSTYRLLTENTRMDHSAIVFVLNVTLKNIISTNSHIFNLVCFGIFVVVEFYRQSGSHMPFCGTWQWWSMQLWQMMTAPWL